MGFGKDGKGQILYDILTLSISSLAANDVVSIVSDNVLVEDFRILRTDYWLYANFAQTDGFEGPIMIGMAAGGLFGAEIEEALEARPTDTNVYPEIEQVMRPVWPLEMAILNFDGTNGFTATLSQPMKGTFNPKWTMPDPGAWRWWAHNLGVALASGGTVQIFAKHFGVWVR